MMDCMHFLAIVALLLIIGKLLYLFVGQVFFPFVLIPLFGLAKNLQELAGGATWAVVTGATDGIGKAYAKELAGRGFNLILVSRNQGRLDATANEISIPGPGVEIAPVDVKTVAFDFTTADSETYAQVFNGVSNLDVGVLVNNVGVNFEYPAVFHDFPGGKDKARNLVIVNCISPTMMTHIFLPQMLNRNRGVVINVASASAFSATPYLGVYSASKCVLPYFVATKMAGKKRLNSPSFFSPSPSRFASSAINTVGWTDRTTGCFAHALQASLLSLVPQIVIDRYTLNLMQKAREACLRKKGLL